MPQFRVVTVLDCVVFLRDTRFMHRITHCSIISDLHLGGVRFVSVEVRHVLIEVGSGAEIMTVDGLKRGGLILKALGH